MRWIALGPDYMRRGGPVNGLARKTGQPAFMKRASSLRPRLNVALLMCRTQLLN